jgi:hypothetical protein
MANGAHTQIHKAHLSYAETRDEPADGGMGYRSVRTGRHVHGDVHIEIDFLAVLNQLGYRALRSKNGQAILKGGAIRVRVTNRTIKETP